MTIAAFDFDGTLTRRDTLWAFTHYVAGTTQWAIGLIQLLPGLVAYKSGLVDNQTAKERVLTHFLGNHTVDQLNKWGEQFCNKRLLSFLNTQGMARLDWHQSQGHVCLLVTASLTFWTQPFANQNGLILIASQPEIKGEIFTGNILGNNCYGEEKIKRLETWLAGRVPDKSYAYGDSNGDLPLLNWVDEGYYRSFSQSSI